MGIWLTFWSQISYLRRIFYLIINTGSHFCVFFTNSTNVSLQVPCRPEAVSAWMRARRMSKDLRCVTVVIAACDGDRSTHLEVPHTRTFYSHSLSCDHAFTHPPTFLTHSVARSLTLLHLQFHSLLMPTHPSVARSLTHPLTMLLAHSPMFTYIVAFTHSYSLTRNFITPGKGGAAGGTVRKRVLHCSRFSSRRSMQARTATLGGRARICDERAQLVARFQRQSCGVAATVHLAWASLCW
jgi:hypothetical protein